MQVKLNAVRCMILLCTLCLLGLTAGCSEEETADQTEVYVPVTDNEPEWTPYPWTPDPDYDPRSWTPPETPTYGIYDPINTPGVYDTYPTPGIGDTTWPTMPATPSGDE